MSHDTKPYLISLHQASFPSQTIDKRPAHRVAFATHPGDGTVHWHEGTLTVAQLYEALSPILNHRVEQEVTR